MRVRLSFKFDREDLRAIGYACGRNGAQPATRTQVVQFVSAAVAVDVADALRKFERRFVDEDNDPNQMTLPGLGAKVAATTRGG
jgi:hypothetical protein